MAGGGRIVAGARLRDVFVLEMLLFAECGRVRMRMMHRECSKAMMMRRSARLLDGRGKSLHGECKHKQPQQKQTDRAVHAASLSRVRHMLPMRGKCFFKSIASTLKVR